MGVEGCVVWIRVWNIGLVLGVNRILATAKKHARCHYVTKEMLGAGACYKHIVATRQPIELCS
jgi:hypothetical protein